MSEAIGTTTPSPAAAGAGLSLSQRVVLVVDLVESVRLMQLDEAGTVERWLQFLHSACADIIPRHQGRLIKSLGDGLMVSFQHAHAALLTARSLHRRIELVNVGWPAELRMRLRAAIHASHVYVDDIDIFGAGVNLAARLAALAGPGETVVSAAVRDSLADGLDATLEDLGEQRWGPAADPGDPAHIEDLGACYLKHVDGLTRVYRVGAAGADPVLPSLPLRQMDLRAAIAVVPFEARDRQVEQLAVGDLIADGVIARLSRARHLRVISRLSTAAFRGRPSTTDDFQTHLGASHVLTGSYGLIDGRLMIHYELCDVASGEVIKADRLSASVADLLQVDSEPIAEIVQQVHDAVFQQAGHDVLSQPLPTLQSFALLLGGIRLLHRSSRRDFTASFDVLDHLVHQHPRCVEPLIWQAKWYALRAVQGLTADRDTEARAALACTARALAAEPHNSFALAMQGFVHCHLTRDYGAAAESLRLAVQLNPSESLGHLFNGVTQGLMGDFDAGIASFQAATANSPLDPARYLFDTVGAYLHLGGGRREHAVALARQSIRQNREHAHSWRTLVIALAELGRLDEARSTLQELLKVQPELTLRSYLAGARPDDTTRRRFADALGRAGLPA